MVLRAKPAIITPTVKSQSPPITSNAPTTTNPKSNSPTIQVNKQNNSLMNSHQNSQPKSRKHYQKKPAKPFLKRKGAIVSNQTKI
jgi:hypothetical protein